MHTVARPRDTSTRSKMSRRASSYVPLLLCAASFIFNAECASDLPDRCLELVGSDIDEIENHLSELKLTDVPTVKMMTGGFRCPIAALPFGTLKSDWARLLLLREAQPDGSIIKLKLVRLMRILIIAYYQMEERVDVTDPDAEVAKKSPVRETMTTVSTANRTSQPHCTSGDSSLVAETSNNNANRHCSCADSSPNDVTPSATENDGSKIKLNATVIEIVTVANPSSTDGTTTVVPPGATRQNAASSVDLGETTTYYPGSAITAKNAASRILGNCLKQSLGDVARGQPSRAYKIFETVKNKARYTERAARMDNGIDDRRISPTTNEFWRYVTFPTRAPLTVGSIAPAHRVRGLNGFKTGLRKSRKRAKLSNDIYESFRRFYGVGKNEGGIKRVSSASR